MNGLVCACAFDNPPLRRGMCPGFDAIVMNHERRHLSEASLGETEQQALRRVLYGLYALVKGHFAKEEEIYLPLLDTRLTAREALQMFEAMEMAAQEAKRSVEN